MKKLSTMPAILASMATMTGCVLMEQVADDDEEICKMESSIGSHVKEEVCQQNDGGSMSGNPSSDRDVEAVFEDMEFETIPDLPVAEGSCGSE